jgi:hypothetical protein
LRCFDHYWTESELAHLHGGTPQTTQLFSVSSFCWRILREGAWLGRYDAHRICGALIIHWMGVVQE